MFLEDLLDLSWRTLAKKVLKGDQDLGRRLKEAEGWERKQQVDVQIEFWGISQCHLIVTEELVEGLDVLKFELNMIIEGYALQLVVL